MMVWHHVAALMHVWVELLHPELTTLCEWLCQWSLSLLLWLVLAFTCTLVAWEMILMTPSRLNSLPKHHDSVANVDGSVSSLCLWWHAHYYKKRFPEADNLHFRRWFFIR